MENPEQSPVGAALFITLVVLAAVALGSLVIRFRRSRGEERQQLKWFIYAGALLLPTSVLATFVNNTVGNLIFGSPIVLCGLWPGSRSCAIGCTTSTG